MINLSLRLILAFSVLASLCLYSAESRAQGPAVKAVPVQEVEGEKLPSLGKAPIIVELFSSQACPFCPEADRLFADLTEQDNVIGLACHVDYFKVNKGSLSKDFCTKRQSWYMEKLAAGPNYTPQMVINGTFDTIGHKMNQVIATLQRVTYSSVLPIRIVESDAKGTYRIYFPPNAVEKPEDFKLWLAVYDKPHDIKVADGFNKGKSLRYLNIVSELGSTDKVTGEVYVTPPLKNSHAGFVVILQNDKTGKVHAVGRHKVTKP